MFGLVLVLVALIIADAAVTYFVIATGAGYEANPAWQVFNERPELALAAWIPPVLLVLLVWALRELAAARGFRTAVRTADVLTALAAVHRAVVVAHNLSILLFGVDLLPPPA